MATVVDLLARCRTLIDDLPGDKSVFKENLVRSVLGNQVGGGNLSFKLNNSRVSVISSVAQLQVSSDGAAYAAPATVDAPHGTFTLAAAPTTSLFATYDWQYFTDAEITDFITQAGDFVEATADVTTVPVGLLDALVFKAASDACFALSARRAGLYDASAGGKSASKGDISKKYRELAKDLFDRAVAERAAFWGPKKGQATSPAYGKFATNQTPWTPRR